MLAADAEPMAVANGAAVEEAEGGVAAADAVDSAAEAPAEQDDGAAPAVEEAAAKPAVNGALTESCAPPLACHTHARSAALLLLLLHA